MKDWKKAIVFLLVCALGVLAVSYAAVPADTIRTTATDISTIVVDHLNVTDTYYWTWNGTTYNITQVLENLLNINATNEWGLVYGTTGDWFNYTDITYTPVYLGLQMHPLNLTDSESNAVWPNVYDKDDYHWQLELIYANGTQCNENLLVMYYAHVEWDNEDGLEYLEPNGQEPV